MFLKRFFSFFLAFSCLSNLVLPNLVVNASKPPRNPFSLSQANSGIPGSNYPSINPNLPPQIIPNNFNRQNDQQRMSAFRPAEVVQITGPNNALVNTLLNANQNNNIINNQNINAQAAQPNVVLPIPLQPRPQNTDRQFNNINQNANMQQQTRLTQRVTSSGSVARITIFPQTQNGNNRSGNNNAPRRQLNNSAGLQLPQPVQPFQRSGAEHNHENMDLLGHDMSNRRSLAPPRLPARQPKPVKSKYAKRRRNQSISEESAEALRALAAKFLANPAKLVQLVKTYYASFFESTDFTPTCEQAIKKLVDGVNFLQGDAKNLLRLIELLDTELITAIATSSSETEKQRSAIRIRAILARFDFTQADKLKLLMYVYALSNYKKQGSKPKKGTQKGTISLFIRILYDKEFDPQIYSIMLRSEVNFLDVPYDYIIEAIENHSLEISDEVLLQDALPQKMEEEVIEISSSSDSQDIEEISQPYNNLNNNFDNLSMISTRTGTSATEEIDLLPFIIEDYRMWRDQGLNRRQAFTKLREENGCSQEFLDQNSAQIRLYDNCEGFEKAYKQKLEELKMLSCKSKGYEIEMFLEDWPEECYDKVEVVIDCFKKAGKIENVNTRLLDISYMIRDFYDVNTADEFIKFLKTRYADEILMRSLVDTHDVRKVNAKELTELDKFTVGSPMILVRVHNVQDFAFPDGLFAEAFRTFAREQGLTSANGNMEQVQQEEHVLARMEEVSEVQGAPRNNTCYLRSALWQLYYNPVIRTAVLNSNSTNQAVIDLYNLFRQMETVNTGIIDDNLLKAFVASFDQEGQQIYNGQQQDASEAYERIVNMLIGQGVNIYWALVNTNQGIVTRVPVEARNVALQDYINSQNGQIWATGGALTFDLHRDPRDNGLILLPENLNVLDQNYVISSVTVYAGTGRAGHYYVYRNLGNGQWARLDNLSSEVTTSTFVEIQDEIATGATMVTYERQPQNPNQMEEG